MARDTKRAALVLSESNRRMLVDLSGSRTAPAREVERAKILVRYADGTSISDIQRQVGVSRPTILTMHRQGPFCRGSSGLEGYLPSAQGTGNVVGCQDLGGPLGQPKPKDHGLAAELWTLSALVRQVKKHAVEAGFPRLVQANQTTVWRSIQRGARTVPLEKVRFRSHIICNDFNGTIYWKHKSCPIIDGYVQKEAFKFTPC